MSFVADALGPCAVKDTRSHSIKVYDTGILVSKGFIAYTILLSFMSKDFSTCIDLIISKW